MFEQTSFETVLFKCFNYSRNVGILLYSYNDSEHMQHEMLQTVQHTTFLGLQKLLPLVLYLHAAPVFEIHKYLKNCLRKTKPKKQYHSFSTFFLKPVLPVIIG